MRFLFALFLVLPIFGFAQQKFEIEKLKSPKKNGIAISNQLAEKRVYEYRVTKGKHAIFLSNGLRSSTFIDPNIYLRKKKSKRTTTNLMPHTKIKSTKK